MIHRKTLYAAVFTVAALITSGQPAGAKIFGKKKKAKTEEAAVPEKKKTRYEEFFKTEHEVAPGMITLHLMKGKLYFEMPVEIIGREMLLGSTVTEISDNRNATVGSKPTAPLHVTFTVTDDKVQLREIFHQYVSPDENIRESLKKSTIASILNTSKIECWNNDSTAVVFEMTDFFVSDNKKLTPFSPYSSFASYKRSDSFKKESSYLSGIKSFGDNISIKSSLTYTVNITNPTSNRTVVKDQPFTVEMTRSLMLLPREPVRARAADYRIGVFWSELSQLGSQSRATAPVYYAHKWNIQPKDTAAYERGEKVEPREQIVFYVDDTFPEWWKPYIREGIEQWNELFEEIGFVNVIRAVDFPGDDPQFDPDNIKYSCVRYVPINIQNAMGPSWVDPRSGQILNASVYVYHDVMKLISGWLFVQTSPADRQVRTLDIPREILGDALRYVVAHEIGHCLGFMHNMSASSVIPVEELRSPEHTARTGTTTSIMDYARFNYVAQPGDKERGVKLTPPRFGEYDRWLVKWTYTPVTEASSFEEEAAVTAGWITEAIKDPVYRYGKQQMGTTLDPRSQTEDLGDNAVEATRYGIANLKYIIENYDGWITEGDEDSEFRREVLNNVVSQMTRYIGHVYANVGGLFINQVKSSDDIPHIEDIPREQQVAALEYLFEIYGDLDWLDNREFLSKMPLLGSPAERVRQTLAARILNTQFKVALYNGVTDGGLDFGECADMVYDFVWAPTLKGTRPDASQMYLQKKYVEGMMETGKLRSPVAQRSLVGFADEAHDCPCDCWHHRDAFDFEYEEVSGFEFSPRSVFVSSKATEADCFAYLKKVERLLKSRVASAPAEARAHYEHLLMILDYALKK
ncbi:MAG: zinc-dependent metalloprotease [Rikenellaceae bacterium]|nr:zinc-dependent metalloprotease [Rikenellaceae bacterium]